MLPKLKRMDEDHVRKITNNKKDIIDENIDPIKARRLSCNKIKLYSLENKIKIILFNSKLFLILLIIFKCSFLILF